MNLFTNNSASMTHTVLAKINEQFFNIKAQLIS